MEFIFMTIASIIIGLLGLVPALFLRFKLNLKYNRLKSAIITIPIATISIVLICVILFVFEVKISNFSIITLLIVGYGTYQLLQKDNHFNILNPIKEESKEKLTEIKASHQDITTIHNKIKRKENCYKKKIILLLTCNVILTGMFIIYSLVLFNNINVRFSTLEKKVDTEEYWNLRKEYLEHRELFYIKENNEYIIPPQIELYELKYNIPKEEQFKEFLKSSNE